jgi:hypothetical protein
MARAASAKAACWHKRHVRCYKGRPVLERLYTSREWWRIGLAALVALAALCEVIAWWV